MTELAKKLQALLTGQEDVAEIEQLRLETHPYGPNGRNIGVYVFYRGALIASVTAHFSVPPNYGVAAWPFNRYAGTIQMERQLKRLSDAVAEVREAMKGGQIANGR